MKYPKTVFSCAFVFLAWAFQGVGTKYLPDDLFAGYFQSDESEAYHSDNHSVQEFKSNGEFTRLTSTKAPILDGNLYIQKKYGNLVIGGVNFSKLKLASRTEKGDVVTVKSRT